MDRAGRRALLINLQRLCSICVPLIFSGLACAQAVPASGTTCNGAYTGTFNGNITVSAGQTCSFNGGGIAGNATLNGGGTLNLNSASVRGNVQLQSGGNLVFTKATVVGNVQIDRGGTFSINSSSINGNLQINNIPAGPAQNQICGTGVKGDLQFQNNGTAVQISAASNCPGNTIGGNLQVQNNTASTALFNNTVSGNLQDQNNTAETLVIGNTVGGNLTVQNDSAPVTVAFNNVHNNLQCQNDPLISGESNTAGQNQGCPTSLTVNPAAKILSVAPATGKPGQTLSATITGASTNFLQGSTLASFGAGISVGGAAEGAAGPVTVSSSTTATAQLVIDAAASPGPRAVTVITGVPTATLAAGFTVATPALTITGFAPQSGTVGTVVTISGSNFGSAPQVSMPGLNGASITLPLQSVSAGSVGVVIPSGAVTGPITVASSAGRAATATPFTVNASSTFTISASPPTANLIVGQTVAYAVQLASTTGFNQLAPLSVSGLPSGVTASFKPASITTGQTSILTLSAPANQRISTATLSISAAATVGGIAETQSASAALTIQAPTTSFLGRAVAANSLETPLAGVTVTMLGLNGGGAATGCTGSTVSDGAGNFALTGLSASCVGPQLVGFGGNSVTSPAGKYASVNLVYTLVSGQVTVSPVLVHLPSISGAETMQVQQNAATDQTYAFASVPGVSVTVYAHTAFTQEDGTQPNPFPLVAVNVPVDRLPELMPPSNTMVMPFIVAFQPANVVASQPVAVMYPSTLNTPPGTTLALMTLNPTLGRMVPYGTATVSADGTTVVPNMDPSTGSAQHRFGIVNFDWHGWGSQPPNGSNPSPTGCTPDGCDPTPPCQCSQGGANINGGASDATASGPTAGEPVDLSSGLQVISATDLAVQGTRGSISVQRIYRTLTTNDGPFGIGSQSQYDWQLNTGSPNSVSAVNLISPDGNQFLFSRQANGILTNATVPWLQGTVMTTNASGVTALRFKNGTVYTFQSSVSSLSVLASIADRNGNTITLTRTIISPTALRITQITDPVARSINMAYAGNGHMTSATDPIGRTVSYTYNSTGTLATMTDPAGGVTQFHYDSQNRIISLTDPRGVIRFQNTYDSNGRVSNQVLPDGGVVQFAYTVVNSMVPAGPVQTTTVTDALGYQTTYRFNPQGFVTDVTDGIGQTKSFTLDPGTNAPLQVTGPAQCGVCGPPGEGNRRFAYDSNGNRLTYTDALGNTTRYTYDPVFNQITSITDPLGNVTSFTYDAKGNLLARTDANGNVTSYQQDPRGLLTRVTDALQQSTVFGYDGSGNPVSATDPLGNATQYSYDGLSRLTQTTDALGRRTSFSYDSLSRLVTRTDAKGGVTTFAYDADSNLVSVKDANGNTNSFAYDPLNRLLSRTDGLGKSDVRMWDRDGNLIQYVDGRGQISAFAYDNLNRLTTEIYSDATVSRSYDTFSRLVQANDSAGGLFTFAYDLNGHLLGTATPYGAVNYTYDGRGATASRQVAGQAALSYTYDPVGNLTSASIPQASANFAYTPRNQLAAINRGNGVSSTYTYDADARLLGIAHAKGTTSLASDSYGYDAVGNRLSLATSVGQPLVTPATTNTFNAANQLTQFGSTGNSFDGNGNLAQEGTATTYKWDGRSRLKSIVTSAGQTTNFAYDFAGNLIQQADSGTSINLTKSFVLDDLTDVAYETASDGTSYSVLAGRSVDSHVAVSQSNGQTLFGLADGINSTVATVDQTGTKQAQFFYEPYGQTTASGAYPFQFAGRTPVTGNLYYNRARFYSATTGRFISQDPIGFAGGPNMYSYVGNNSTGFTDPLGLASSTLSCYIVNGILVCILNTLPPGYGGPIGPGTGKIRFPPEPTPIEQPLPGPGGEQEPPPEPGPVPIPSPSFCPDPTVPPAPSPFPIGGPIGRPIGSPFPVGSPGGFPIGFSGGFGFHP